MKTTVLVLLAAVLLLIGAAYSNFGGLQEQALDGARGRPGKAVICLSMVALLANPAMYNDREVILSGHVAYNEYERLAVVYFNQEARDYDLSENAIFLDTSRRRIDANVVGGRMCRLRGVVDANNHGPDIHGLPGPYPCALRLEEVLTVMPPRKDSRQ